MWELNEERTYLGGYFTVRRRPSDFMAYAGDTRTWEAGRSPEEALGKLVITLSAADACATSL